jgi:hypothetical protein
MEFKGTRAPLTGFCSTTMDREGSAG